MELFGDADLRLIEALIYDAKLAPGYELLRGCLVWADETHDAISAQGRCRIHDLQAARSLIYHRTERLGPISPELQRFFDRLRSKYCPVWERAIAEGLRWPGFHPARIELSDTLLEAYRRMIDDAV